MATLHQLIRRPEADRACVRCGYRVRPRRASSHCPMCGGKVWRLLRPTPESRAVAR